LLSSAPPKTKPEFLDDVHELPDLIRLCFTVVRLQVEQPRNLRVPVNMMATADPAKGKAEGFDQPTKLAELNVAQVPGAQPIR
jgi:hypothetical protein